MMVDAPIYCKVADSIECRCKEPWYFVRENKDNDSIELGCSICGKIFTAWRDIERIKGIFSLEP